jgi:large subunit ribosomal protein L21
VPSLEAQLRLAIRGAAQVRGAYDLETYEWTKPLCCGLKWGDSTAPEELFIYDAKSPDMVARQALAAMHAIRLQQDVVDWWAHNGGKYDALFIAKAAADMGWEIQANIAGSRAIVLETRPQKGAKAIRLLDSFAVAAASLKNCAKDWGLKSAKSFTDTDYSKDMRSMPYDRLREGCLIDSQIVLEEVLMVADGDQVVVGTPRISGATVTATVVAQGRGEKIRIFKMRRRKHYQKHQGHRQNYTEIRIDAIAK